MRERAEKRLAPRVLPGTSTLSPDRADLDVIVGAGVAVLVVRPPLEDSLRRIL